MLTYELSLGGRELLVRIAGSETTLMASVLWHFGLFKLECRLIIMRHLRVDGVCAEHLLQLCRPHTLAIRYLRLEDGLQWRHKHAGLWLQQIHLRFVDEHALVDGSYVLLGHSILGL